MRVRELALRNFRVFEEVDLELPARVIGIFGPNGSGKSTLVESIGWALYGRARTDKRHVRTHGVLTDCLVRMVFEHGGGQYEIRRAIVGKNHHTEAELLVGDVALATGVTEVNEEVQRLLRMDDRLFRASAFAEQKQLDAFSDIRPGERKQMVLRLLGIRPVEQAVSGARKRARDAKGDADRVAKALPDPGEQKDALDRARRTADDAATVAKEAAQALRESRQRAEEAGTAFRSSDRVRQQVEKLVVELRGVEEATRALEERGRELAERIEVAGREVERLPGLEEEHHALAGAPDRLAAARQAAEAAREAEELESSLATLPEADPAEALAELQDAQEEVSRARDRAARAEAALERAREELAAADEALGRAAEADPSEPCPTCGRPLGDEFERYVDHLREEARGRRTRLAEMKRASTKAATELTRADRRANRAAALGDKAREAVEARARVEDRLSGTRERLRALLERFRNQAPGVAAIEAEARREKELAREIARLSAEREHLDRDQAELARVQQQIEASRARVVTLETDVAALAFDPEEHSRLEKESDEAARLLDEARAAEREAADRLKDARAKVRALQAEVRKVEELRATVGELREEARYVERVALLLDGFRDHLVSRIGPELSREAEVLFRELTDREYDDLRIDEETLAITIADGTDYFSIERFSGSESDLANLALRVAISVHLSRMSGADVGMMVLDEILGSLDAERKDLFVQAMGRLASRFHQLFVITHAEQVKDAFPASIEVRKAGRRRSEAALV